MPIVTLPFILVV